MSDTRNRIFIVSHSLIVVLCLLGCAEVQAQAQRSRVTSLTVNFNEQVTFISNGWSQGENLRLNLAHNNGLAPAGSTTSAGTAQGSHVLYQDIFIPVGLARGQSLRYTLFLPDGTPVRAQVKLYDARGNVVAVSDESTIAPQAFHSFDFHRYDLPLAGEGATGRLQLRGICSVSPLTLGRSVDGLTASVEIIEDTTGNTTDGLSNTFLVGEKIPAPSRASFVSDYLIGLIPGQTLRLTGFNASAAPPPGSDGLKYKMLVAVLILDVDGRVIAQSQEIALAPGEFHSFDFNRDALNLIGESTGRVQVRAQIRHRFFSIVDRTQMQSGLQLTDNLTGRSAVTFNPKEITINKTVPWRQPE